MMARWSMMNRVSGWRSMSPWNFHGIVRVVAVHRKGGDEDRAIDADRVHGRHHLVTGDVSGPIRDTVPGPFRSVRLVDVDLGIDDRHREAPQPPPRALR